MSIVVSINPLPTAEISKVVKEKNFGVTVQGWSVPRSSESIDTTYLIEDVFRGYSVKVTIEHGPEGLPCD